MIYRENTGANTITRSCEVLEDRTGYLLIEVHHLNGDRELREVPADSVAS